MWSAQLIVQPGGNVGKHFLPVGLHQQFVPGAGVQLAADVLHACGLQALDGALHTAKKSAEILFYRIHFSISPATFLFIFLIRLSAKQFLNILIFIDDIFLSYHKLLCLSSHIKLL